MPDRAASLLPAEVAHRTGSVRAVDGALANRVDALLAQTPIFDGHNDLLYELRVRASSDLDRIDLRADLTATGLHTDLSRMRAGRLGAQFWSVWAPDSVPAGPVTAALEQIDLIRRMIARYPDHLMLALSADDVERAHATGRVASLLGLEGGHLIGNSLGVLRAMHALGIRYLTLTHILSTEWADSASDERRGRGLSAFGRDVVRELNRIGVLVDLAHVAPATMHAALDVSRAPAFFSHSAARALCDSPRNVPDDVLVRVRDTNGLVMVAFVNGFLTEDCRQWMDAESDVEDRLDARYAHDDPGWYAARASWIAANPPPPCGVDRVADHIQHVRDVAGVDCVGIGSDFDGMPTAPDGLADVAAFPALVTELAGRGWSDLELSKLTWHNALRVLRDTESVARG